MTRPLASSFFHARLGAARVTALLGLATAAFLPAAQAALPDLDPGAVVAGDTFSIEMVGYNTSAPLGDIYLMETDLMPAVGKTLTYANAALGGQTVTVTSGQTISGGVTKDTLTVSVPSNFVPTGTLDNNGNIINAIAFAFGTDLGGTNTLDFTTPLPSYTVYSGSATGTSVGTISLAGGQNPLLTNSNMSLSNEEAVFTPDGSAVSADGINSFTFTVTVPEPSTYATMALGAVALFWVTARRRTARA